MTADSHQRFDNRVVKFRTNLLDGLIRAVGPGAIRQQHNGELALRINPQRGTGVAEMSERSWPEIFSRLRGRRRCVAAQCAGRACGRSLARSKQGYSLGTEDRSSAMQHGVREASQILGRGEKSSVSGAAAQHESIFILHFTLDDFVPKSPIVRRGWNLFPSAYGRIKSRTGHPYGAENFAPAESVERFVRETLQSRAQQDESNIAVFCPCAGIGRKGSRKGSSQQLVTRSRFEEQLLISGQPRGVSQKDTKSDVPAAGISLPAGVGKKLRDGSSHGRTQL